MAARVLIVDGFPLLRLGLSTVLGAEPGLTICAEAGSWAEALDLTRRLRPDLAIVDLSMRDGVGLGLVRRLKAEHAVLKVLALCIHDEHLLAERALTAGALGFVNKGDPIACVVAAVRRVLAGKVYLSEQMADRVLNGLTRHAGAHESGAANLTDRELEVFGLLGQGLGTATIAERLHVSAKTVESHRDKIKRKLGVSGSAELVMRAVQWRLSPS